MAFDVGEDFSMLDEAGRVAPDLERAYVSGFRAHAERIIRRWIASLGLVWYARDFGGGMLDLLNTQASASMRAMKAQELRQQALAEPGTTGARVTIALDGQTLRIAATIDAKGHSGTIRINLNTSSIAAVIS